MSSMFIDEVYAENLLQQLWQQCETDKFCDVVLIAGSEGMKISAHRAILSIASGYFKGMFESLCESTSKEVSMPSVNGDILKSLVQYCYTGRVEIREDNVQELLEAADMLLLNNIVTACANFLTEQLHPTNCLGFKLLAERYRCQPLSELAEDYSLEHFMDVYKTEEFLRLNTEQLSQLLACDDLRVSAEEDVFNSLMTWIQHDRIERQKHKENLLKLVRMPLLDPLFLYDNVKQICTSRRCVKMYFEAMEYHSLPERRTLIASTPIKSRRSCEFLMGITLNGSNNKMHIHYYCTQRLKWLKWLEELECRKCFGLAIRKHNLYITGGRDSGGNYLNTVVCLNMKTMTLTHMKEMTERRAGCCAAFLNGFLYVVGGYIGCNHLSSAERWDPKTDTWIKVASMSVARCDFGMVELHEKLYAVGGNNSRDTLSSAENYDPHQNVWTSIASMSESRFLLGVAVANGLLYAVSGSGRKTVERYDTVTNAWTFMCNLREEPIDTPLCTIFRDKVIVCYGDCVDEYNSKTNEWELNASLKGLANIYCAFSYSDTLLRTKFAEN